MKANRIFYVLAAIVFGVWLFGVVLPFGVNPLALGLFLIALGLI